MGLAHRAGHVAEQGDHMHPCAHMVVDGQLDRRHVRRDQHHGVAAADAAQREPEFGRVAGVQAVGDLRDVLVAEVARRLRDMAL